MIHTKKKKMMSTLGFRPRPRPRLTSRLDIVRRGNWRPIKKGLPGGSANPSQQAFVPGTMITRAYSVTTTIAVMFVLAAATIPAVP